MYFNFLDKFCNVNKFEELEMKIVSLYLALVEEDSEEQVLSSKRASRMK